MEERSRATLRAVAALTESGNRPPVVLVHGAANSSAVWTHWQVELAARGWSSYAIDLRGHGAGGPADLSHATMQDYADDVCAMAGQLRQRPVVMGWSMGGLVALMMATAGRAAVCVALAPSVPAWGIDASVELRPGELTAEEYGITSVNLDDQPAMPDLDRGERAIALASLGRESLLARDERRRGIVIESLPCPALLVTGTRDDQWPSERYDALWLAADRLSVEGASHWGLVLNRRALQTVVQAVARWLEQVIG